MEVASMEKHKYTPVTSPGHARRIEPVVSIDEPKEIARQAGSTSFLLIPKPRGTHRRGYTLEGREYEKGLARVSQRICPGTLQVVDGRGEVEEAAEGVG
jgi:hypothetical protein